MGVEFERGLGSSQGTPVDRQLPVVLGRGPETLTAHTAVANEARVDLME